MTIGVTLAMIGFCMYSHTKLRLHSPSAKAEGPAVPTRQPGNVEEGQPLLFEKEQQTNTPKSASLVHRS